MTESAVQSHHRALNQTQHIQTQLIYIATVMYINQRPAHLFMLHDLGSQSFQCSHCDILHFKDEMIQSGGCYFSYCLNNSIKLFSPCSISSYLKNLFITEISEIKHFQQQINVYNNAMTFIFCMFNQNEHLNHSIGDIQSFIIYEELYHLQGPLQHSFMCVSLFAQAYLYNSQAAIGYWFMNTDESLCESILF